MPRLVQALLFCSHRASNIRQQQGRTVSRHLHPTVSGKIAVCVEHLRTPLLSMALFRVSGNCYGSDDDRDQNPNVTFNQHERPDEQRAGHSFDT